MRACLAILKDSFREAAASRVLWLALGIILLVLVAISPLGLTTVPSTHLRPFELLDQRELLASLASGRTRENGVERHIWSLLSQEQQENLDKWSQEETNTPDDVDPRRARSQRNSRRGNILREVNRLIRKPEFYSPEAWSQVELSEDLKAPDSADLDEQERSARNLKRFAAAFASSVEIQGESSLALAYGTLTMFGPLMISETQVGQLVDEIIIGVLLVFLGFFGIFGSLLVTAPMIPRTFEPGEISLLLSKPVRRATIFVTKFVGGCAFTLLCAALLVTGIWILLWLRLNLWRPELLWCIPLYVFLFAIYYSVSAFAGAVWRNPIVSLILVVVFWVLLATAGAINDFMTRIYMPGNQLSEVASANGRTFAIDGSRDFLQWDDTVADWVPIMEQPSMNPLQAMFRVVREFARPRLLISADGTTVYSLQSETPGNGAAVSTLVRGSAESRFEREVEGTSPEPVFGVFQDRQGELILPAARNIYRYSGVDANVRNAGKWIRGMFGNLMPSSSSRAFESLTKGQKFSLRLDAAVAFNSADDSLTVWNNGTIQLWSRTEEGQYKPGAVREIDRTQSAVIAAAANRILITMADGRALMLDSSSLETQFEGRIESGDKPRSIALSGDGQWGAILTHGGQILVADNQEKSFRNQVSPFPNPVSAIQFDSGNRLLMASRRSVVSLDLKSDSVVQRQDGRQDFPFVLYDYGVRPLYRILPKPRELDFAVRYLVTGEKTMAVSNEGPSNQNTVTEDLQQARIAFDPWSSLWSNLGFIAFMLLAGCIYTARSDF